MTELYEITYDDPTPNDRWQPTTENIILYDDRADSCGLAKFFGDVVPLKWCLLHDMPWLSDRGDHSLRRIPRRGAAVKDCVLEDPVAHWVTVKETT